MSYKVIEKFKSDVKNKITIFTLIMKWDTLVPLTLTYTLNKYIIQIEFIHR